MKDSIAEIRELRNGARVTLHSGQTVCLTRRDMKAFALQEGDAVDLAQWKHDLLLDQYPEALNRAVRLLAVRARSCAEIAKRLTDACYMQDTVDMVLTKLETNGLVDDEAFAVQWARDRALRQIGKARIAYELRQKGVSEETSEKVLAEMDPDRQEESAVLLARKLLKRHQSAAPAEARRKAVQAMQRRGYSYGEARSALQQAAEDGEGDN